MQHVRLHRQADCAEWRDAARTLLLAAVPPQQVDWQVGTGDSLFPTGDAPLPPPARDVAPPRVPPGFLELAEHVLCHSDPGRFALLYRLLVRVQGEKLLLDDAADPDVAQARLCDKSVRRDSHKMTAFVRFREVPAPQGVARRRFLAWFEPNHWIVALTAPFFAERFADMDWMILTPKGSAIFEAGQLRVADEPAAKPALEDATDALWKTYYASIFNPARLKVRAMQQHMPQKYWKNLPEAALIPELIANAPARVQAMAAQPERAAPAFHARLQARPLHDEEAPPRAGTLAGLKREAAGCTRCPLYQNATQTVFGEGPVQASLMFVGEQPGDREDLAGRPFVGPAGQVFDAGLRAAGIERSQVYVTNAVKHFKHVPRGKLRLHQRPLGGEIERCRWWLDRELELVQPRLVVALGATALAALAGPKAKFSQLRGQVLPFGAGRQLLVTVHPAYLLRLPDAARQQAETEQFHRALAQAQSLVAA
jgi:uracil-DNA glycosylase